MKTAYSLNGYAEPLAIELDTQTRQGQHSFTARLGEESMTGEFTMLDTTSGWLVINTPNNATDSAFPLPNGHILPFYFSRNADSLSIWLAGQTFTLTPQNKTARRSSGRDSGGDSSHNGDILAPLPGRILRVPVTAGDSVSQGTPLVILESMKMETTIAAPFNGIVSRVKCEAGAMTEKGALLLALTAQETPEQPDS